MDRNFRAEGGITLEQLKIWLEKAIQIYKIAFALLVIGAIVLVILGVKFNRWDMAGANFILALVFLIVWAFFEFHPAGLLVTFGLGGLNGLPKNWSLNQFIREGTLPDLQLSEVIRQGFELIKKLSYYSMHIAFFMTVMFMVLGTFELKTAKAVLPVFIALAGIGLWSILAKVHPKWYFRVTGILLFVSLAIFLYKGFVSGDDETVGAPAPKEVARSFGNMWSSWNYRKTFDLEITSFQDHKLCGIRSGTRTFSIPSDIRSRIYVTTAKGENTDITSTIRLNGTVPGETFEVENKCVTVSFAFNQAAKQERISPRVIHFTVE